MIILDLPSIYTFPGVKVDKTKTEFEIFSSNFQAVNYDQIFTTMANRNEVVKSKRLSKLNRLKGNEAYLSNEFKKALEFYYLSLAYAPFNSVEYAFAIGNRTAALFLLKRYEECLTDIEKLWDTNYPVDQLFKIYIRQSLCFLKLEHYYEAFEANTKARENLIEFGDTLTQAQYDKIQGQINNIFAHIEPFDFYSIEYNATEPEYKNGENPNFLNASKDVDLEYNDTIGRYVVANTDIEKGDILFVEQPYSAVRVATLTFRYTYCSNCLTYCASTIPCNGCIIHFYCSQNCKQLAWDKAHKWECFGERKRILRPAMRLPLNIMFKAAQNNFNTVVDNESVFGNKDDNFAFLDKLVTNKSKMTIAQIRKFTKLSIWLVIYLKEYTNFFTWLQEQPNNSEKSMAELFDLIGGILLKLCMQIQCNYNDIVDVSIGNLVDLNLDYDFIGYGLYVSTSMINHSCAPNALVTFDQSRKVIRAAKNIKKGTEITIDYAYFTKRVQTIAPSFFLDTYKFTCTCLPCNTELSQIAEKPWICYRCHGKAIDLNATEAKCLNCQQTFCTIPFKNIEMTLVTSFWKAISTSNSNCLNNIVISFRTIYHPEHEEFINYYKLIYNFYIKKQNAPNCLNICKMFVKHCEKYCNSDLIKLQAYLRLMNASAIYYSLMKKNEVSRIQNYDYFFCETMDKTHDLLQFFVSGENIKNYISCFLKYLIPNN